MNKARIIKSTTTFNGSKINSLCKFTFSNNIKIDYTDPGAPNQKGLVDANQLLRKYKPKKKGINHTIVSR